jgi:tetratricopeptide (TPR) repeat protein
MKTGKIGRYGIDWGESENDLTKEDYETILIETTKIIEKGDFSDVEESSMTFFNRGVLYHRKKDYQKSLSDFTSSINLTDDFFPSYYNRGYSYYHLGKHAEALKDFEITLKLNPDDKKAKTWIDIIKSEIKQD